MSTTEDRFSRRHGYGNEAVETLVRSDASRALREAVVAIAYETYSREPSRRGPGPIRNIICQVLHALPDPGNWSDTNIREEIFGLIHECEWYEVYDIIEAIERGARKLAWPPEQPTPFSAEINRYFVRKGIGWKLVDGNIVARAEDAFEQIVQSAHDSLQNKGLKTSSSELNEAIKSLSVRPDPDVTGAIQHAMAALECVAREVTGNPKPTLGEIMKKNVGTIPPPLDSAIEKTWGFASEQGRHLREGRVPDFEEAQLVVGMASAVSMYLSHKMP